MARRGKVAARRGKVAALLGPASSEDEAPEEVTFGAAREAAQTERKRVGEAARRHRELLKEKRRRRQELFAEQKKRKLLPEAVLQELAAAAPPAGPDEQAAAAERGKQSGGGAVKQRQGQVQRRVKKEKQGKGARSKGNYTAVRLKDQSFTGLHQQLALDFVKAQLYGPHANRAQANEFFSLENKKKPVKSAAVQFVDKSWGMWSCLREGAPLQRIKMNDCTYGSGCFTYSHSSRLLQAVQSHL